jgi:hypothetical protein
MKARTHYTTPITETPWMRRGRRALVALLVLVVGSLSLITALRLSATPTAAIPAASTRPAPIGACQACRDEWLAAMQPSHVRIAPTPAGSALRAAAPAPVLPATRQQGAVARVFRDEVLGADQANLSSITLSAGVSLQAQQEHLRQLGPR